jgi:hypothetical protein
MVLAAIHRLGNGIKLGSVEDVRGPPRKVVISPEAALCVCFGVGLQQGIRVTLTGAITPLLFDDMR